MSVRARAVRSLASSGEQRAPAGGRRTGEPSGDRVIIRIVDRGPGIPPAQLERVFEPFYRAGTPGGEHRGSGLGLAIARGFAEANDGWLHVESLPGQGATFVFEFPLRVPAAGTPGAPGVGEPPASAASGSAAAESDRAAPPLASGVQPKRGA